MRQHAFTLIELLVVTIIIGILATVTLPNFTRSFEIAKGRESETMLRIIFQSERAYYFDRQCPAGECYGTLANLTPRYLPSANLDTADWRYDFSVLTATTFTARARRNSGPFANPPTAHRRTIDQNGTLDPATWPP